MGPIISDRSHVFVFVWVWIGVEIVILSFFLCTSLHFVTRPSCCFSSHTSDRLAVATNAATDHGRARRRTGLCGDQSGRRVAWSLIESTIIIQTKNSAAIHDSKQRANRSQQAFSLTKEHKKERNSGSDSIRPSLSALVDIFDSSETICVFQS